MRTDTNVWSYVLSAPNTNSYIAMGFSEKGKMVGSTAIVGWVSNDGTATMKKYFLGGQSPNQVCIQISDWLALFLARIMYI